MRRALRERRILKRIAADLSFIFESDRAEDPNRRDAGELWDDSLGNVEGGKNYSEDK